MKVEICPDVLETLATGAGMDGERVRGYLASGEGRREVKERDRAGAAPGDHRRAHLRHRRPLRRAGRAQLLPVPPLAGARAEERVALMR